MHMILFEIVFYVFFLDLKKTADVTEMRGIISDFLSWNLATWWWRHWRNSHLFSSFLATNLVDIYIYNKNKFAYWVLTFYSQEKRFLWWRNSNVVNGGHILQRKLKEKIILNKYDLKWKETSEKCKWEHHTR